MKVEKKQKKKSEFKENEKNFRICKKKRQRDIQLMGENEEKEEKETFFNKGDIHLDIFFSCKLF